MCRAGGSVSQYFPSSQIHSAMPPTPPQTSLPQTHLSGTLGITTLNHTRYHKCRVVNFQYMIIVDASTFTFALLVGKMLNWHDKGRERLDQALSDTENGFVNSVNRLLKFGINAIELSTQVLQRDDGQCFAALCASLSECYFVNWTAKISLQLIKKIIDENPDDQVLSQMYPPSLQAITTLVERYCGLLLHLTSESWWRNTCLMMVTTW